MISNQMECEKCIFYTKPMIGSAKCTKINNHPKSKSMPLPLAQKICKGYFFAYDDLYPTKDASLSAEKNPHAIINVEVDDTNNNSIDF